MARGRLFAVVGPSGAGKDTLINGARARLSGDDAILFVRRTISRAADGVTEDHETITEAEFAAADAQGAFCVSWRAHGLCYGIPQEVRAHVTGGGTAVVNGSRRAMDDFAAAFGDALVVVEITARPEIIAQRLAARGRESAEEIEKRLTRSVGDWAYGLEPVVIDNSGELDAAVEAFVRLVRERR